MKHTLLLLGMSSLLFIIPMSPSQGYGEVANCAIDQGPCAKTSGMREVTLEITPRPVTQMKELTFAVRVTGRNAAPALLLDLSMPGMYMGRNEVILKKRNDGAYEGKGIIPRCPSGKRLWRAEVTIPGAGKASYLFNVGQ